MVRCAKYLLYANPSAPYARCAFYNSATGCRQGDKCPFAHAVMTEKQPLMEHAGSQGVGDDVDLCASSEGVDDDQDESEAEPSHAEARMEVERIKLALEAERQKKLDLENRLMRDSQAHDEAERLRAQIAALRKENEMRRRELLEESTPTKKVRH